MITTVDIKTILRDIQNTDDESKRLACLAALREYVAEHPDDEDAVNILDKYSVLNQDYTKTLRTPGSR